jgi:hypothetical protein
MMNLPKAARAAADSARAREIARQLRDVAPALPNWEAERAALAAEEAKAQMELELRPGVRIEHLADGTSEITATADKKRLFHTYIARNRRERVDLALRELIRAYQILQIDFATGYGDHDDIVIGTEPKD